MYDVVIIGGGASGLAAGITAKERGMRILILENAPKVGKKLLATGNGKCNLSNISLNIDNYNNAFIAPFLDKQDKFYNFFEKLGLKLKQVEDRIYPYSESAATVSNILREKFSDKEILCETLVDSIAKNGDFFVINGNINARNVVIATGSNATSGVNSHNLALYLGHKVSPLKPCIVPLTSDITFIKKLANLRAKACVSLVKDGKKVAKQTGEILFKDNGLSGIAVFMLSSYIARNQGNYDISIDFAPDLGITEVEDFITKHTIFGLFHKAIAESILYQAKNLEKGIAYTVKNFVVEDISLGSEKFAQCIHGGLITDDFDENLQSKLVKNLYACGEVLDIDGDCGGYNLYWAFISGIVVGENIC